MLRLLISAVVLLGAHSIGVCAGPGGSEEEVLRSLLAKRNMRCPTASSCDQPSAKGALDLTIAFSSGSARLEGDAGLEIQRFVTRYRTELPDKPTVTLSGYTDGVGDEDYNRLLSRRRAVAVSRVLIGKFGFPAKSIKLTGHGIRHAGSRAASPADRIVVMSAAPRP